jgi:flavin reductase (DIM6/NTAB) family NADH-FMN oxidoreductase RutF
MNSIFRKEGEATRAAADSRSLRQCLGHFATGVAVATYEAADHTPKGLTVNSFTSVSLDPPLILLCLSKRSKAIGLLPKIPFAVNVLGADQHHLAGHFAGRPSGAMPVFRRLDDIPLLERSLAWMTCVPWSNHDAGDHVIVVGRVREFGVTQQDPLCFYRGQFTGVTPIVTGDSRAHKETTP